MNSTLIETQNSFIPDSFSSFLEDFQFKNSHLFPSTDLASLDTSEPVENQNASGCGKRKRDCFNDSFSNWNAEFLLDSEALKADALLSRDLDVDTPQVSSVAHVDKKRKMSEDEELSLFMSDARSRSPPFQALDFDLDSVPSTDALQSPSNSESAANVNSSTVSPSSFKNSVSPLDATLNIISQTNPSVRASMFESLSRIANNIENGELPVSFQQARSATEQLVASQDYLAMQTLFGMAMRVPPIVKQEHAYSYFPTQASQPNQAPPSYYPLAGIPFVMNNSYAVPLSKCIDIESVYKQSQPTIATSALFNPCNKNMAYPVNSKYLPSQYHQTAILPAQNIYQNLHVL